MNYGKNRTSKKEKDLASQQSMAHKRFRVMFLKTFLICILDRSCGWRDRRLQYGKRHYQVRTGH